MRRKLLIVLFLSPAIIFAQGNVGINTSNPQFVLDVRGTDNNTNGGELQLGTPDATNFLRFFGGRLDDRHPFIAFHDLDTFHIVTTLADWSTYTRRLTMLPNGNVGIGTEEPGSKLEVNSVSASDVITIKGYAESTGSGLNIGVSGWAASEFGQGVVGTASNLTGTNYGVYGRTFSEIGYGVYGFASSSETGASGTGIYGISVGQFGKGVSGFANHESGATVGVRGRVVSTSGRGVHGISEATSGTNYGVYGQSASSSGFGVAGSGKTGVYGQTTLDEGIGVYGQAIGEEQAVKIGVMGKSESYLYGVGVYGEVPYASEGKGVEGQGWYGVYGKSTDGYGLYGLSTGAGYGVRAVSGTGWGVYGTSEWTGVSGTATADAGENFGVSGYTSSPDGYGVFGKNWALSGGAKGVYGEVRSTTGRAVMGKNTATTGTGYGLYGESSSTTGIAVYGKVTPSTGLNYGIYGETFSSNGRGVFGYAQATSGSTRGVVGTADSPSGTGVLGNATSLSGQTNGVYGISSSADGKGVRGDASGTNGKALYGYATGLYGKGIHVEATGSHSSVNAILAVANTGDAYAGYFVGRVHVAGNLSKASGSFKIDHPVDPANKYLYHSFVESPDMMNIYNGNIVTDASGNAVVELPGYFEALNMDFRYQLTVIGSFAQAIVSEEISDNRFSIMTDKPNIKVSWQVTGVRQDEYAKKNRIIPEVNKEPENKGKYLNPEVFAQPEASRIGRANELPSG